MSEPTHDSVRIHDDELLSQTQLIESQPLAERAALFEQLYETMLGDLQRSDEQSHEPQQP